MGVESVAGSTHLQLLALNLELERYEPLMMFIGQAKTSDTRGMIWDALDAYVRAAGGDRDGARELLAGLVDDNPWETKVGWQALLTAAFATEAAWWTDVPAVVDVTHPVLASHSGRCVVAGHSTVIFGPVDRFRGLAALLRMDVDDAIALLEVARDQATRGGAHLWQRWCEADLVSAHMASGTVRGHVTARRLLQAMTSSAEVRCSQRLATRTRELEARLSGPAPTQRV